MTLRDHGVEPAYVRELGATGYALRFPFRVVEFHEHGITPEWLRGVVEAGYKNATPDQLIAMHEHGIDAEPRCARPGGACHRRI